MRGRGISVWAGVLLLWLGTATTRADDENIDAGEAKPSLKPKRGTLFGSWSGADSKPKEVQPKAKAPDKKSGTSATPPSVQDDSAGRRSRDQAAYLRRLDVCDRLMQVAVQTNDKELQQLAEHLSERVTATYLQKNARLPIASKTLASDESVLDKKLADSSANSSAALTGPASSKNRNSQAAVREVKP